MKHNIEIDNQIIKSQNYTDNDLMYRLYIASSLASSLLCFRKFMITSIC